MSALAQTASDPADIITLPPPRPGLTPAQLAWRRGKITATDVPKILGLSRWGGPADVLLAKTKDLADSEAGEAAATGQDEEEGLIRFRIRRYQEEGRRVQVRRNQMRAAPNGVMGATLDAAAYFISGNVFQSEAGEIIEAKTAGIYSPFGAGDEWGDDDTDEVPEQYFVQGVAQLICVPSAWGVTIPALLGGRGRMVYNIRRDTPAVQSILTIVEDKILAWHDRHIVKGEPLPKTDPAPMGETLKRVRRVSGKTISIPDTLVTDLQWAKQALKTAEKNARECENAIKAALDDAEIGECSLGKVTYKEQSARRLDAEAVKAMAPEVFEKCYRPGKPFRVLRLPKVKGGEDE